jgi:hypothetical protein
MAKVPEVRVGYQTADFPRHMPGVSRNNLRREPPARGTPSLRSFGTSTKPLMGELEFGQASDINEYRSARSGYSSKVSRTRSAIAAGSSSIENATVRSNPWGPVIRT